MSFLRGLFGPPNIKKLQEERNIEELAKALDYGKDVSVPKAAARALGEIGDAEAMEVLIATLRHSNEEVRVVAAQILGQFDDKTVIEGLATSLQDDALQETVENILERKIRESTGSRQHIKHIIVNALGHKSGKRAVGLLLLALEDEEDIVRGSALSHLVDIGDERAFDHFIALLNNEDWLTRQKAVTGLANIGDKQAVNVLIQVRNNDNHNRVRDAASQALDSLGWQPASAMDRAYQAIAGYPVDENQWVEFANNLGEAVLEPLIVALNDKDSSIAGSNRRCAAVRAIGQIVDDRVLGILTNALKNSDRYVRMAAAKELGRIGDKGAVKPLVDALFAPMITPQTGSDEASIRGSFAFALAEIGDERAIEPLLTILDDIKVDTNLRVYVAEALGDIGDERAIEPLTRASAESESRISRTAKKSLEKLTMRLEDAKSTIQVGQSANLLEKPDNVQALPSVVKGPQGQEFILIPAGTFLLGSTEEELKQLATQWGDSEVIQKAHLHLEMPQHEVKLTAYYIGKHPVTNAEWQAFVDAGGYENETYWPDPEVLHKLRKKTPWYWPDPKWSQPDCPVVGIGWDDCMAYCKWLSAAMERKVRLLTEAEWEKAAGWNEKERRKRRFPWGNEWDSSRCNSLESNNLRTTPVGHYSPAGDSAYGVADMVGNVSEYCSTIFSDVGLSHFKEYPYPYQKDDGREDIGATFGEIFNGSHIQRGGNWDMKWLGCRCSFRETVKRGIVNNGIGVRVGFSAE